MSELTVPSVEYSLLNDRDLLRRFVQDADELAFAEIVRRHQGLVMGVCRRVIGNAADIDDAFQATFITLARRPRQIRRESSLSSWLYTVAWRTSIRLVRQRRKHPVEPLTTDPSDEHTDPLDQIASAQHCLVLDEELNILPSKYREVLVMTYFAGQGSQQIADQLNVSKGTIDGRIRQARNMLRVRLARRGVAISVLAVAAGLSSGPNAAAATPLLESTIQLGAQTLSGSLPGTTDISHLEAFIRQETTMLSSKLLLSTALCVTAVVGLVGMNGYVSGEGGDPAARAVAPIDTAVTTTAEAAGAESVLLPVRGSMTTPATFEKVSISPAGGATTGSDGGPRFKPYPADARPTERWMYEILEEPVPLLDFPGDTPLQMVLETISTHYTKTYGSTDDGDFALNIWVDKSEFELEGFSSLEDITVSDVNFEGMTLQNALDLIFEQTTEPELTYEIRNEVLHITTLAKAESDEGLVTRVYNVEHLLHLDYVDGVLPLRASGGGEGSGGFGGGGGGGGYFSVAAQDDESVSDDAKDKPQPVDASEAVDEKYTLVELVQEMTTPPCRWVVSDGEGGAIKIVGRSLVVRQTQAGHREIVRLLNLLTESIGDPN
jgi:RNA polymerase sigma factor (sigma-70 family)